MAHYACAGFDFLPDEGDWICGECQDLGNLDVEDSSYNVVLSNRGAAAGGAIVRNNNAARNAVNIPSNPSL